MMVFLLDFARQVLALGIAYGSGPTTLPVSPGSSPTLPLVGCALPAPRGSALPKLTGQGELPGKNGRDLVHLSIPAYALSFWFL